MARFFLEVLTAYIVTCVITSSSLFAPLRERVMRMTPRLVIRGGRHPVECRLCLGFWVSLLVCLCNSPHTEPMKLIELIEPMKLIELITRDVLPVYGASYFLATQERG